MLNTVYIPSSFSNEILSHITGVYSSKSTEFPLLLGIFGEPGNGKTYMCEQLFLQYNIKKSDFSVNEFENASAGVPAKNLRNTYDKIVKQYSENRTYGVLMINDIDTAIGNWGGMHQYTINTQLIIGELMQIADPHINYNKRIPIIITGNNFTTIYNPLKRSGRISPFYWKPSEDELVNILVTKFPTLTKTNIKSLINQLNSYAIDKIYTPLPVSFFTSLPNKIYKKIISNVQKQNCLLSSIIDSIEKQFQQITFSEKDLLEIGKKEIDNIFSMNKSHLGK